MLSAKGCDITNVKLTNILGQEIFNWNNIGKHTNSNLNLPISTYNLAKGIYLITVNTPEESFTKKLIIR